MVRSLQEEVLQAAAFLEVCAAAELQGKGAWRRQQIFADDTGAAWKLPAQVLMKEVSPKVLPGFLYFLVITLRPVSPTFRTTLALCLSMAVDPLENPKASMPVLSTPSLLWVQIESLTEIVANGLPQSSRSTSSIQVPKWNQLPLGSKVQPCTCIWVLCFVESSVL